ncbi:MAG: TrmH family RNA methyltransferase [Patescibacteria group bacterium]
MISQKQKELKKLYLILHNIRSVHNVGSIFRTSDAAGVSKIFLTGYTPRPVDRFNKKRKDLSKVALGAEKTVSWEGYASHSAIIDKLKKEGFDIVALEQSDRSIDYKSYDYRNKTALLVGNEVKGLSSRTLSKVDNIIEIPMKGEKESLNVSVACGVALFRIMGS